MINKIITGDCLDLLTEIPNNFVNLHISDPPYFQGMTHNGQRADFNDFNISKPFFKNLFAEWKRTLHKDGEMLMFTDWRGYAFYYTIMQEYFDIRNCIVWDKGNGQGSLFAFQHEFIIFATHKGYTPKAKKSSNILKYNRFGSGADNNAIKVHPTQKPIELMERLIELCSNENDIICDSFSGSGTAAVAARNKKRNFICFELQEKYAEIAKERLKILN